MAKTPIADRIKAGPLLPKWKQLVAKNKDIANLKGDVEGDLAEYDKNLKAAADTDTDAQKAWDGMKSAFDSAFASSSKTMDGHFKALDKLKKDTNDVDMKMGEKAGKIAATDKSAAMDIVSNFSDSVNNFTDQANAMFEGIMDARKDLADAIKKASASAGKTIDDSVAQKKKLEDSCNALETSVSKTITDMQKQAIKQNQDKVADILNGFLKSL